MITELTYNDLETLASVEGGRVNWERWECVGPLSP